MKKNSPLCIHYGYKDYTEEKFKKELQTEYGVDGYWIIKKMKSKYYWYFRRLGEKRKDIYLCELEKESFTISYITLLRKLTGSATKSTKNKPFTEIITQYIVDLENRGLNKDDKITTETARNRITGLRDFRTFCDKNHISISQIESNATQSRLVIKKWFDTMITRQLKRGTIKSYVKSVRLMLEDLSRGKEYVRGYGLLSNNYLTKEYQNNLLEDDNVIDPDEKIREYKDEYYWEIRRLCLGKVRQIWMDYCENRKLKPITDRNNKVNQPTNSLGKDVVYFISLLQLISGCRIKEILHSFINQERMIKHRSNHNTPNSNSYSFWDYDKKNNAYYLTIRMKRKFRKVPFIEVIHSYHKPPEDIPCEYVSLKRKQNGYDGYYQTNIIDVLKVLSSNEWFMFPSPNH